MLEEQTPDWMAKPVAPIPEWALGKPPAPEVIVIKEGVIPGENRHITYLVTGGVVLLCVLLAPLLLILWTIGWGLTIIRDLEWRLK